MSSFDGFKRRAVVLVPTDAEFQRRVAKREAEEGKDIPDSAVLDMKGTFLARSLESMSCCLYLFSGFGYGSRRLCYKLLWIKLSPHSTSGKLPNQF